MDWQDDEAEDQLPDDARERLRRLEHALEQFWNMAELGRNEGMIMFYPMTTDTPWEVELLDGAALFRVLDRLIMVLAADLATQGYGELATRAIDSCLFGRPEE